MTTYREAAGSSFGLLRRQVGDYRLFADNINQGFWHAANTLHTCIDYLVLTGAPPDDPLVSGGIAFFEAQRNKESDPHRWGFWRDDYGWWGRALLKAYRNADALGVDASTCLARAELAWTGLQAAWDDSIGGCWNNPLGGDDDPLRQRNSVTNELFWLLSKELAEVTDAQLYKDWVAKSSTWYAGLDDAGTLYDKQGRVLEEPTGHQYEAGWVWTGDQGLFALAQMTGGSYPTALRIVGTVAQTMCANGVLTESTSGRLNTDVDFAAGKGVFCRSARDISDDAVKIVLLSASGAWNNRPEVRDRTPPQDYTYQYGYDWSGGTEPPANTALWNVTLQTAGQDALNSAVAKDPNGNVD